MRCLGLDLAGTVVGGVNKIGGDSLFVCVCASIEFQISPGLDCW